LVEFVLDIFPNYFKHLKL